MIFQLYLIDGRGRRQAGRDVDCHSLRDACTIAKEALTSGGEAEVWDDAGLAAKIMAFSATDFQVTLRRSDAEVSRNDVTRAVVSSLRAEASRRARAIAQLDAQSRAMEMARSAEQLRFQVGQLRKRFDAANPKANPEP